MADETSIKVSAATRDRLALLAAENNTTIRNLVEALAESLPPSPSSRSAPPRPAPSSPPSWARCPARRPRRRRAAFWSAWAPARTRRPRSAGHRRRPGPHGRHRPARPQGPVQRGRRRLLRPSLRRTRHPLRPGALAHRSATPSAPACWPTSTASGSSRSSRSTPRPRSPPPNCCTPDTHGRPSTPSTPPGPPRTSPPAGTC